MFSAWLPIAFALTYVAILFAVAYWGDRTSGASSMVGLRTIVYSLSLAVYCTSWTFFGAVGTAAERGWAFLPIYLGPVMVFLFGWPFLVRVARICRQRKITSIADFVAARYQKSGAIAALVTIVAVAGAIPYIALQLKAITMSLEVLTATDIGSGQYGGSAFYVALALALFSILFGTRELDASEHHRGMMWAIALESAIKLIAFVAVAIYAGYYVLGGSENIGRMINENDHLSEVFSVIPLPDGFVTTTLLAAAAIFCLPRQFHVAIVEYADQRDILRARWVFPLYLAIFSICVVPITVAGVITFGEGMNPDTFVLALPLENGDRVLALLAFLGGFSAATGMVIVATIALATMVSNDLVLPAILRFSRARSEGDLSGLLLQARRVSIVLVSLASYGYFRATESAAQLASIGLLSFAAAVQFAPAMVGAVYWRRASRSGAFFGLAAGFSVWLYTLFLPAVLGTADAAWLANGPLDIGWLKPQALFGVELAPLTHGVVFSMVANIGIFVGVSSFRQQTFGERLQADAFMRTIVSQATPGNATATGDATLGDLKVLASRFIGAENAEQAFATYLTENELRLNKNSSATPGLVRFTEILLAGSIGASSARNVVTTALRSRGVAVADVETMLNEASQAARFNRRLLEATLNSMPQGVSVVDQEMRLVGWNEAYLQMFDYPEGMVYVGRPVEDLIRFNAQRGLMGEGSESDLVRKRVEHMRAGARHRYERHRPNGTVLEMRGSPMPDGGYVTTFTDITRHKRTEEQLREINENLERLVMDRTSELRDAMQAQRVAKQEAEDANQAKTRFLAAASHDLLQPLNAARLFSSVLMQDVGNMQKPHADLAGKLNASLDAAEDLLGGILEISKIDRGKLRPELEVFSVSKLMEQLSTQFSPVAEEYGLELRVRSVDAWLRTDRQMLHRIIQNFVSNALRYTAEGGVLVAARSRCGGLVEFSVWDTGPGIPESSQTEVFNEFQRLEIAARDVGLGLGLAICDRLAKMLGHEISLRSRPGAGSRFAITVPRSEAPAHDPITQEVVQTIHGISGVRILCIDNEPDILEGMKALLESWGCHVALAKNGRESASALDGFVPELVLADYHLEHGENGVDLARTVRTRYPGVHVIILTADRTEELEDHVRDLGFSMLRKPIKPGRLRTLISRLIKQP